MGFSIPSTWQQWLHGLGAAFIGAAAANVSVVAAGGSWQVAAKACGISGILSAAAYLAKSPLPPATATIKSSSEITVEAPTQETADAVAHAIASKPAVPPEGTK